MGIAGRLPRPRHASVAVGLGLALTVVPVFAGTSPRVVAVAAPEPDPSVAAGQWVKVESMSTPRMYPIAVPLKDGRVLVTGGQLDSWGDTPCSAATELYDPRTGIWSPSGAMHVGRCGAKAVVLRSGKVLVAGGYRQLESPPRGEPDVQRSAELFDPATGVWTLTGPLHHPRFDSAVATLPHDQVLVAGGMGVKRPRRSAEVYDPRSGRWTLTGRLKSVHVAMYPNGMATELSGGDVLIAGGGTGQSHHRDEASAERYDVSSGKWRPAGQLSEARDAWLFTLPGGDVLAIAGYRPGSGLSGSRRVDRYDPRLNSWRPAATLPRTRCAPQVVEVHGRPWVIGGYREVSALDGVLRYEARPPGRWVPMAALPVPLAFFGAVPLRAGGILVVGGLSGLELPVTAEAFRYVPRGGPTDRP